MTFLQVQLKKENSFLFAKHIEQLTCCIFSIFFLQFKHIIWRTNSTYVTSI